ncbi:hypothetical protein [Ectothiorhodospira mobilis]|uniref:Uncharacterized protein n=1 Tax=Ectothiorhodospira mobilis TaxID=195064 RepID=A0A1I4RQW7_ECTMO|nr:hypothetical protein [Ectothiorhodospira mobilis]MCG5534934.1 hypothetical protein [Ectothiorhodospira mobilis]SFM54595.1 hypothetical protein SAMN05421721_10931 [Ectothiorhodospira mobilis]
MKVELRLELDVDLTRIRLRDVKALVERLFAARDMEAIRRIRVLDVRLGEPEGGGDDAPGSR